MNSTSPKSLQLARELLALEAAGLKHSTTNEKNGIPAGSADEAVRVCERLRDVLTAFAGIAGFQSLLTRALSLAQAQDRSLAGVRVLENGSLAGLEKIPGQAEPGAKQNRASQILVAQLLDLLVVFIGEPLTHQLVRDAWPQSPQGARPSKTKEIP